MHKNSHNSGVLWFTKLHIHEFVWQYQLSHVYHFTNDSGDLRTLFKAMKRVSNRGQGIYWHLIPFSFHNLQDYHTSQYISEGITTGRCREVHFHWEPLDQTKCQHQPGKRMSQKCHRRHQTECKGMNYLGFCLETAGNTLFSVQW